MATMLVGGKRAAGRRPPPRWVRALRALGWTLIGGGVVVLLFVVYLLFWTGRETAAAQADLVSEWRQEHLPGVAFDGPEGPAALPVEPAPAPSAPATGGAEEPADVEVVVPPAPGDAWALLWFEREGVPVVVDRVLAVVEGVGFEDLARGPGHYPGVAEVGRAGNVAVAGHRTTYGQPFHALDQLRPGDEIHVVDRQGRHWVYDYLESRVVGPGDTWVIRDDAVPGVTHLLTLTTCHPKYSARQRLVAFAELRGTGAATTTPAGAIGRGEDGEVSA